MRFIELPWKRLTSRHLVTFNLIVNCGGVLNCFLELRFISRDFNVVIKKLPRRYSPRENCDVFPVAKTFYQNYLGVCDIADTDIYKKVLIH